MHVRKHNTHNNLFTGYIIILNLNNSKLMQIAYIHLFTYVFTHFHVGKTNTLVPMESVSMLIKSVMVRRTVGMVLMRRKPPASGSSKSRHNHFGNFSEHKPCILYTLYNTGVPTEGGHG